jgi:succinate dehydrogenase / fumarate reductase iron-sulfur subunit
LSNKREDVEMASDITVRIKRRSKPDASERWETFKVPRETGMNVTTILQRIAAKPETTEGQKTTPVSYDACCLEEVCGACSMVINGQVRQACSALVENLVDEAPEITLEPMTKFPVVRDLVVNRRRMFDSLKKVKAWVQVDGYDDRGPGPKVAQQTQEEIYPLSRCMTCGCCLEACPQFNDHTEFLGAAAISQAVMFNQHPTGKFQAGERLDALTAPGGIADCGNAQNCVKVCPKDIPLTTSIAKAGRAVTFHTLRKWFDR